MNFQQVEETVEQYDPQGSVVRSRQKQEESATTAPNSPLKQNETTNYEVSKSVRHVVNPIGKIDRISVAVIIDNHTKVTPGLEGQPQTTQDPRTADEMKKYKDLVSAAIGFNPERGDQLTIENISFEGEMELVEVPTFLEKQGPIIITGLRYLIIPVVFILLYLLLLRPVQRTVLANWAPPRTVMPARAVPRLPGPIQTPMTVKQLEAQLNGIPAVEGLPSPEEYAPLAQPSKIDMIRKRVVEQAQADPETVAKLVRVWLNDERKK
jgi:flagellar M-ring protein FliF